MKPSEALPEIRRLLAANLTPILWGAPGVGKTSMFRQVSRELGLMLRTVILSTRDPVDVGGLPWRDPATNRTRHALPYWWPTSDEPAGILFFDELATAHLATQAPVCRIILERTLEDVPLPAGWRIAAASNRLSDRAGTNRLSTALTSRIAHLTVQQDVDDWTAIAQRDGFDPRVIAYVRLNPSAVEEYDPSKADEPFSCGRTMEMLSDCLKADPSRLPHPETVNGIIGAGHGSEFYGFATAFQDMPKLEDILADPDHAHVPTHPSSLTATSRLLGRRIDMNNWSVIARYVVRLHGDYHIPTIEAAAKRLPELRHTREYVRLATGEANSLAA